MKTITQLQADLRAAAERIESLSLELAQLQPSGQKKGLDFAHIQAIGTRYPILDHCLVQLDGDFQRKYLTLLAAPLLLESQEPENGWLFLQRILCGTGCAVPLADLQADAAMLTDQQLDSFSAAVLERGLADALMLDGMLLYLSCRGGEDVRDWLAALAELLGRTLDQIRELARLAVLISKEDREGLKNFIQQEQAMDLFPVRCHIFLVLDWYIQVKSQTLSVCGNSRTPLDTAQLEKLISSKRSQLQRIEIRNALFSDKAVTLNVGNCQLLLENCVIQNINSDETCFYGSGKMVTIRRCCFEHLSSPDFTIDFRNCPSLVLEHVSFNNIQSTEPRGYTLNFDFCQMQAVTMEKIKGHRWYSSWTTTTVTPDCYYKNCVGDTFGLPIGMKKKA